MLLESLCQRPRTAVELPIVESDDGMLRSDWQPLLGVLTDRKLEPAVRAEIFHSSIATAILRQAVAVRAGNAVDQVGLCGGVFQNRVLTEQVVELLREQGFDVFMPEKLPCNDAALSFGQAAEIAARDARVSLSR